MNRWLVLILLALALPGCASPTQQGNTAPAGPAPTATPTPAPAPTPSVESTAPPDIPVGQLVPDADRVICVKGTISSIVGIRLVPPKVILKVTDDTGTVLVLINEKAQLSEGMRVELVGNYKPIPSPTYDGPGEAPLQNVFVVDRYLDLP